MQVSFVCSTTGRTVCTIDSGSELTLGRQPQFGIADSACSREQALIGLMPGKPPVVAVKCIGAGRLRAGGRQLARGETARLTDGEELMLGNSCRLLMRLRPVADDPDSEPPKSKKARLVVADRASDSDETFDDKVKADEIEKQLELMRKTAAKLASQSGSSKDASQSGSSKDASQSSYTKDTSQSGSSKDASQSGSSKDASQSGYTKDASQSGSSKDASQSGSSKDASQSGSSKDASQSDTPPGWRDLSTVLVYTSPGCRPSAKIAGFDMDGTLICTQSGRVFAKDASDWQIIYPVVPGKLKSLVADGYKLVVFSNQKGVEAGKLTVADIKQKVEKVATRLGAPLQAFLSVRGLGHRKPCSGMWHLMTAEFNSGMAVSLAESFYVGDAAGRPADSQKGKSGRKADFSSSDRLFAINCRLSFHTPEEFFLGHRVFPRDLCRLPEFRPPPADDDATPAAGDWPSEELRDLLVATQLPGATRLLLVLVGFPASGKSALCRRLLSLIGGGNPIAVVSRDQLGTWQHCVKAAEAALTSGSAAVLVDNTSLDAESRARYVECARRVGVSPVCLIMSCSLAQCLHNERYRRLLEELGEYDGARRKEPVSEMVFNQMRAKYSEPSGADEGFDRMLRVPFVPRFRCDAHRALYCQYLMEK